MTETPLYAVRRGRAAAGHGERVVCAVLGWMGRADGFARVRIAHSTRAGYRTGQIGMIRRDRLVPRRPRPVA